MGDVFLLSNLSRPHRLIELSNTTQMASRTLAENSTVLLEKRGVAFWITLNRPEKRNAINRDIIDGVREGYQQAHADPGVRVIVLTSAGEKAFCAGADL